MEVLEVYIEKTRTIKGYIIAELTDSFVVDYWPFRKYAQFDLKSLGNKSLEIRIFNESSEYKVHRADIGHSFQMRNIIDEKVDVDGENQPTHVEAVFESLPAVPEDASSLEGKAEWDIFDEIQYLDIDSSKGSDQGTVISTGGGKYNLPVENIKNPRIRIRHYIGKYNSGQARVEDWRIVEFVEGN